MQPRAPSTPPSRTPETETPVTQDASIISRIASGAFGAVLASLACTGHAAARLASAGAGSWPRAWIALAACAFVPALLFVVALPRAVSVFTSFDRENTRSRAIAVCVWLTTMQLVLYALGALLRRTTHHHALAGTTFALTALVLGVVMGFVVARVGALASDATEGASRAVLFASGLSVVVTFALLVRSLTPSTRLSVIDAAAFIVAVFLASRTTRASSNEDESDPKSPQNAGPLARFAFLGVVLALGVVGVGVWFLRGGGASSASGASGASGDGGILIASIDALAPLYSTPASLISGR